MIDRVAAQASRAGGVIRRLREFVAKGETERSLEDLNKVVEEAVALAIVGAREHGVRLSMRLDTVVAPVLVDRVQLQQVVLNLVRNAVEAMEQNERKDLVVATRRTEGGQGVEIQVIDTGPASRRRSQSVCSSPSTPTRRPAWASGFRSAAGSSRRMAGASRRRRTRHRGRCSP